MRPHQERGHLTAGTVIHLISVTCQIFTGPLWIHWLSDLHVLDSLVLCVYTVVSLLPGADLTFTLDEIQQQYETRHTEAVIFPMCLALILVFS